MPNLEHSLLQKGSHNLPHLSLVMLSIKMASPREHPIRISNFRNSIRDRREDGERIAGITYRRLNPLSLRTEAVIPRLWLLLACSYFSVLP
ncbi:hypothetical protein AVEN_195114-1 [Araneus ventricosus]|uniref:Uncharacterized protein n=1 Tax=Araneus ventricosus TaxID=182803 RepID=A0A4Y2BG29_ARAVE|nr:hypothetical protein AVEN_195114-1 [Araneus ventricosus]